jgi:hypothetical protein
VAVNWLLSASVALLALAVVIHAHVQVEARAWSAWTLALTDARQALLRWLRTIMDAHTETIAGTLHVARADHGEGEHASAQSLIASAQRLITHHALMLRTWLQRWSDTAAVLMTLPPSPVLPPGPTKIRALRELSRVQRLGDVVLPTRALRFRTGVRLRVTALKWLDWTAHAASLRARQPGQVEPALDLMDAACADLAALDRQTVATLEHLLRALPPDGPPN